MRKTFYCNWTNEGPEGCEGPWFDGLTTPSFNPDAEFAHIYHSNQEEFGFRNPVAGLRNDKKYVVEIDTSPGGEWIMTEAGDDEISCHVQFRAMTKEESKIWSDSMKLDAVLGYKQPEPTPTNKTSRLDDIGD